MPLPLAAQRARRQRGGAGRQAVKQIGRKTRPVWQRRQVQDGSPGTDGAVELNLRADRIVWRACPGQAPGAGRKFVLAQTAWRF